MTDDVYIRGRLCRYSSQRRAAAEEFSTTDAKQAEIQIKAAVPRRQGRTPGPIPVQTTTALQAALEQIA